MEKFDYSGSRKTQENKSLIDDINDALKNDGKIDDKEAKEIYDNYKKLRSRIFAITKTELGNLAVGLELDKDSSLGTVLKKLIEKSKQKQENVQTSIDSTANIPQNDQELHGEQEAHVGQKPSPEAVVNHNSGNQTLSSIEPANIQGEEVAPQVLVLDTPNVEVQQIQDQETQAKPDNQDTQHETSQEIEQSVDKNEVITFFDLKNSDELIKSLEQSGLDLFSMLNDYKKYIENNLSGLDDKILSKIKQSILIKTGLIKGEVDKLLSKEKDKYGNLDNFKNNRWILNSKAKDLFDSVVDVILPNALFLAKYDNSTDKDQFVKDSLKGVKSGNRRTMITEKIMQGHIKEIKEMFDADIDQKGDFNEGLLSTQNVLSPKNSRELQVLQNVGYDETQLKDISLLDEKDKEIESQATKYFMMAIAAQMAIEMGPAAAGSVIPVLGNAVGIMGGAIIGGTIDAADIFSDTEVLLDLVQDAGLVDPSYRMEKTWVDNTMAGIGLLPGMTALIKGKKLTEFLSKIPADELNEGMKKIFSAMKEKVVTKGGEKVKQVAVKGGEKIKQVADSYTSLVNKLDGVMKKIDDIEIKNKITNLIKIPFEKLKSLEKPDLKLLDDLLKNISEVSELLRQKLTKLPQDIEETFNSMKKYVSDLVVKSGGEKVKQVTETFTSLTNKLDGVIKNIEDLEIRKKMINMIQKPLEKLKSLEKPDLKALDKLLKNIFELKIMIGDKLSKIPDDISETLDSVKKYVSELASKHFKVEGVNKEVVEKIRNMKQGDVILGENRERYIVSNINGDTVELRLVLQDEIVSKQKINLNKLEKDKSSRWLNSVDFIKSTDEDRLYNSIYAIDNFDEMISFLKTQGNIGKYASDVMIDNIQRFRNWEEGFLENSITRTGGLRDKVALLRNKEIVSGDTVLKKLWPKGLDHVTKQGEVGNCYFVAAFNALKNHPNGGVMLKNMISEVKGGWLVKFEGYDEVIKITLKDIEEMGKSKQFSKNIGDIIIERAHARAINKIKRGERGKTMLLGRNNKLVHEGGFSTDVFKLFFGDKIDSRHIDSDFAKYLETNSQKTDFMGLYSKFGDGKTDVNTYRVTDINGRFVSLHYGHAYTIYNVDKVNNIVDVVNPHNSGEIIKFRLQDLDQFFSRMYVGKFTKGQTYSKAA